MTEQEILAGVLAREGHTFTNRPADRGGPTKFGITLETLRRWRRRPVSAADVDGLTEPEALDIYRAEYVAPWAWLEGHEGLRTLLVDWTVTSGLDTPTAALQRAIGAEVDGVLGPRTKALTQAALSAGSAALERRLLAARIRFYLDLALEDPPMRILLGVNRTMQAHNLRGWVNRCLEFL